MAGLLAVHAILATTSWRGASVTFDEPAHLAGGYAALVRHDNRLAVESLLADRWLALPWLVLRPQLPAPTAPAWEQGRVFPVGAEILWNGGRSPERLIAAGRLMALALSLALGGLVFATARSLFGATGGLVALAAYALSPAFLANALATTDLAAALALLAASLATWRLLDRLTVPRLLVSCALAGLAFLVKTSAIVLLPVGAVLAILSLVRRRPMVVATGRSREVGRRTARAAVITGLVACHVLVAVLMAWAAYGFRFDALARDADPPARAAWEARWTDLLEATPRIAPALGFARRHHLLPDAFLHAHGFHAQHSVRPAFLNGLVTETGRRWFFPYVFLVKTPLALLALLGLGAAASLRGACLDGAASGSESLRRSVAWRGAPVWTLLVVYWACALAGKVDIGHRHLLPTYPPLFVLAGASAAWCSSASRITRGAVPVLCAALALETGLAWPNYIAYFNPLDGGPSRAWHHVVDSSLDWGQDLPSLASWLRARGLDREGERPVYLSYFGTADPVHHGIKAWEIASYHGWSHRHGGSRGFLLTRGVYCFSVTTFQGVPLEPHPPWTPEAEASYQALRRRIEPVFSKDMDAPTREALTHDVGWRSDYLRYDQHRVVRLTCWLRAREPEPDAVVGRTILIWDLDEAEVRQALVGSPPYGAIAE